MTTLRPTVTVTFLFTDIEGSTLLLRELGEQYADVLRDHGRIVRETLGREGGVEIGTEGDSFFAVFDSPTAAVRAVIETQVPWRVIPGPRVPRAECVWASTQERALPWERAMSASMFTNNAIPREFHPDVQPSEMGHPTCVVD